MTFLSSNLLLIVAFIVLEALLGANIAILTLPLGEFRILLHLGTAVVMAVVVAAIFMDLRHAGAMMRLFALGGLMWLAFMWLLFPVDYLTR